MPQRRRQPPTIGLLRRYHPGIMLLVGAAVGAGVSLPNTFLRTFAAEREIHQIGIFFATYALVAFAVRISTRRLFERYGSRPWVLLGLTFMASSALLYLMVRETWQLVVPGLAAGIAHALLFPAVVAGGSTAFPERQQIQGSYRRQTVETRRAAGPRGTDSKPPRPRSGERSYVTSLKCYCGAERTDPDIRFALSLPDSRMQNHRRLPQ